MKTAGGDPQPIVRLGRLSIVAAIAIPNVLTLPDPEFPDSAYLIDENRLSKLLDKLDDGPRVLLFIEDPGRYPFPFQCTRPLLDVFQGPTGD